MSGGTPRRVKSMRLRHCQGFTGSCEDIDLENETCSRPSTPSSSMPKAWKWVEVMENVLWIASVVFIIYWGDRHSNLIYLLCHDDRVKRTPLFLGLVGVALIIAMALFARVLELGVGKFDEKWEMSSISTLPFMMLLGLISFSMFSFALWPIWSFLTLPLLLTLFMACLVLSPCVIPVTFKWQADDAFRVD